jgi:hypothetical protein
LFYNARLFRSLQTIASETSSYNNYDSTIPLALNPSSAMFSDIVGIYHDPEASSIRVIVQGNWTTPERDTISSRKPCLRPYLIGRLSGPAVGIVSRWVYLPKSQVHTVIEGRYHVVIPGTYFLEVIVILCNTYKEEQLRQAQNVATPGIWTNDPAFRREMEHIVEHCVENPERHRLTAQNVSIQVKHQVSPSKAVPGNSHHPILRNDERNAPHGLRGYWEWNASSDKPMEPLYTRYEELSCISKPNCREPGANLDRFAPYRFVWTANVNTEQLNATGEARSVSRHVVDEGVLRNLIRLRSHTRPNDTICLIGDSHSLQLADYLTTQMNTPVALMRAFFADDIGDNIAETSRSNSSEADQVNKLLKSRGLSPRQCTVIVLGLGAWVRVRR